MDAMMNETLAGRELEANVLTKAAAMMEDVKEHWGTPDSVELLGDALTYNQLLWSVFQAELIENANPMPPLIKSNILTLGDFVGRYTQKVSANPEPRKLDVLISINRNLAAGLRAAA